MVLSVFGFRWVLIGLLISVIFVGGVRLCVVCSVSVLSVGMVVWYMVMMCSG